MNDAPLSERATELVESWANGNWSDVLDELENAPAAIVAFFFVESWLDQRERHIVARRLQVRYEDRRRSAKEEN